MNVTTRQAGVFAGLHCEFPGKEIELKRSLGVAPDHQKVADEMASMSCISYPEVILATNTIYKADTTVIKYKDKSGPFSVIRRHEDDSYYLKRKSSKKVTDSGVIIADENKIELAGEFIDINARIIGSILRHKIRLILLNLQSSRLFSLDFDTTTNKNNVLHQCELEYQGILIPAYSTREEADIAEEMLWVDSFVGRTLEALGIDSERTLETKLKWLKINKETNN